MIKFCLMHVLHLGILHWCNGASMMLLIASNFFNTRSVKDCLEILTLRFRKWCSLNSLRSVRVVFYRYVSSIFSASTVLGLKTPARHNQPHITAGCLYGSNGKNYAELRLKAFNSRMMAPFLATCLNALLGQLPHDERTDELQFTTAMMLCISNWMLRLEGMGRFLSYAESQWVWTECCRIPV